jgi:hypothetical protein
MDKEQVYNKTVIPAYAGMTTKILGAGFYQKEQKNLPS